MRLFFLLLLFVILIKCFQSKKFIRKFVLVRDEQMDQYGLSQFSILNSNEKEYLYRLKTRYIENDEIIVISYPSEDIVGYLDGQWKNEIVNITFEIFDRNTNQSTNGTINKIFNLFIEQYLIQWNNQTFFMKKKLFSINWKFSDEHQNILGQFRMRFRWFSWSLVKYDLKIFVDTLPDLIYFFSLIIQDHRKIIL